ncbi:leucyl aminopeptidase [Micrococcales bacterium KH10]|nr:leucyl aminopeptidase [Micrococcales bacterium KH10]
MVDPTHFTIDTMTGRLVLPEVIAADGTVETTPLITADHCDTVVLAIQPPAGDDSVRPTPGATAASLRYGVDLADAAERCHAKGKAGECNVVSLPRVHGRRNASVPWDGLARRIILLGIGEGTESDIRTAGAALWRHIDSDERTVIDLGPRTAPEIFASFAGGLFLGAYRPKRVTKTAAETSSSPQIVMLSGRHRLDSLTDALGAAQTVATGTWLARDLANTPSNIKTPQWFAAQCEAIAAAEGLDITVHDESWLADRGFGATLAVAGGSANPPRFVVISHEPVTAGDGARHVVIVGKGITYDSGGLCLKPRTAMVPMKTDMAGAATAVATALVARRLNLPDRITVVVPVAENAISGSAYRPGDVLTTFSGATVEVTNTDAEGRLILAEALSWAVAELEPDLVIDIATLTGASRMALGDRHGVLYSNDDETAADLEQAASRAHEYLWRMPLVDSYRAGLESSLADIRQTAASQWGAGSIMAALFLEHFAPKTSWAHLDIAGAARAEKPRADTAAGATGYGVGLLAQYLLLSAGREQ